MSEKPELDRIKEIGEGIEDMAEDKCEEEKVRWSGPNRRKSFTPQFSFGNVVTLIWVTVLLVSVYWGLKADMELLTNELKHSKDEFKELKVAVADWEKQKNAEIRALQLEQAKHWHVDKVPE